MKKEKIFVVSAAVTLGIACVSSCFAPPVVVHADFGDFAALTDYVDAATGSEAAGIASSAPAVAGGLWAIRVALENPIHASGYADASSINYLSGVYYLDGVEKIGSLCYEAGNFPTDTGLVVCGSDDYYITISGASQGYLMENNQGFIQFLGRCSSYDSSESVFFSNSIQHTLVGGSYLCASPGLYRGCEFTFSRVANFSSTTTLSEFLAPSDVQGNTHLPACPFQASQTFTLPSGDIDYANPDLYLENVFRPWVVVNYPDYVYLLPDPEPEPTETLDPSETMPGLPVIQLPTVPPPEYDMELPEKMLEGAGFWFTALTEVLDEMGWLAIVIVLAVIAIVLYYVF